MTNKQTDVRNQVIKEDKKVKKFTLKRDEVVSFAKDYSFKRTLLILVFTLFILILPSVLGVLFASPTEMYGRSNSLLYDFILEDIEDRYDYSDLGIEIVEEDGYVKNVTINEDRDLPGEYVDIYIRKDIDEFNLGEQSGGHTSFVITEDGVMFMDNYGARWIDISLLQAESFYGLDFTTLFETILIYNNYFTTMLPQMLRLVALVFIVIQIINYVLFTFTFNLLFKQLSLTNLEMFKVLVFNSVIPSLIASIIGIFLPTTHIFIAQVLVAYFMYKSLKSYEVQIKDKEQD